MKFPSTTAIAVLTIAAHATGMSAPLTPEEQTLITATEEIGQKLFDAVSRDQQIDVTAESAAKSRISDFCDMPYKAVPVPVAGQSQPTIFFIARTANPKAIVFGRHYRVSNTGVSASTKSCFVSQPSAGGQLNAHATHVLSPYPTEFHVFLSLEYRTPIFVGTSKGTWAVEAGKIKLVQAKGG